MSSGINLVNATSREQRACVPPLWLLWAILIVPLFVLGLPAADENQPSACGKNETKTDQGCAKNPRIVHKTEPEYPREAWRHRAEGSVTLHARVTEAGTVDEIKVTNSQATDGSFIASFEDAAVLALSKWRYRPATIKGKPVAFYFTVTMTFTL